MASIQALTTALRTRFNTEITVAESVITQFDNLAEITPPDDSTWCSISISPQLSERVTIGPPVRVRHRGLLVVQIFTPLRKGDNPAWVLADKVKDAFNAVTSDGVLYLTPSITRLGRSDDSKWWQLLVTCPYQADEVTT